MYKNKTLPQVPIPTSQSPVGHTTLPLDPPFFQQKGSHECPWGLGLTSGTLMVPHPGRRKGTGPGGLGSALYHFPVIAQKEGSEGVGTGQSCVAAQGHPSISFYGPLSPGNASERRRHGSGFEFRLCPVASV